MKNHGQEHTIAEEEIRQLREILASVEAVVIGAGSGLSTSAGYTYSGKRFETYFGDFVHRYGFSDMYTGGFYPYAAPEEFWAYWTSSIATLSRLRPAFPANEG